MIYVNRALLTGISKVNNVKGRDVRDLFIPICTRIVVIYNRDVLLSLIGEIFLAQEVRQLGRRGSAKLRQEAARASRPGGLNSFEMP